MQTEDFYIVVNPAGGGHVIIPERFFASEGMLKKRKIEKKIDIKPCLLSDVRNQTQLHLISKTFEVILVVLAVQPYCFSPMTIIIDFNSPVLVDLK